VEHHELEAIVAAILAGGAAPADGATPRKIVQDYRRVLKEIQDNGGLFDTSSIPAKKGCSLIASRGLTFAVVAA